MPDNPFDKFDDASPSANPFDRFDAKPADQSTDKAATYEADLDRATGIAGVRARSAPAAPPETGGPSAPFSTTVRQEFQQPLGLSAEADRELDKATPYLGPAGKVLGAQYKMGAGALDLAGRVADLGMKGIAHGAALVGGEELGRDVYGMEQIAGIASGDVARAPRLPDEVAAAVPKKAGPPTATQALIADFTGAGVDPNLATVSKSVPIKTGMHVLQYTPMASGKITEGVEKMLGQTTAAREKVAGGYGEAGTPEIAGRGVKSGIESFAKSDRGPSTPDEIIASPTRASSFSTKSGALYDRFDEQMPASQEFMVPATLNALKGPVERFPTNPELGKSITNSKLQSWFNIIAPKVEEVAPKYSSIVDPTGRPVLLQAAQKLESGGKLTFGEMKGLREYVGRLIGEPALISDIPRADLKSVYGALSHDMLSAAHSVGPEAVKAFERANAYYKAGIDRIDALERIMGNNLSPEQVYQRVNAMASDGARANIGSLRALRKSLGDTEWNDVASTMIRRMGEPTPGTANPASAGAHFSPASFVTGWSKLTPQAKDVLFGTGPERQGLERLVRVATAEKDTARYANASRSGQHGVWAATGAALVTAPVHTTMMLMTARAAAEALMNPAFVKWLADAPVSKMAAGAKEAASGAARGAVRAAPIVAPPLGVNTSSQRQAAADLGLQ